MSNKRFMAYTVTVALLLSVFSLYVYTSGGVPFRWGDCNLQNDVSSRNANVLYNNSVSVEFRKEDFPSNGKENILVVGNSFARDFINAALANDFFRNVNLVYTDESLPNCLGNENLSEVSLRALELLRTANHIIFPSGGFAAQCAESGIRFLEGFNGARVIVVGTKNFGWSTTANIFLAQNEGIETRVPVTTRELNVSNLYASHFPERFVNTMSMITDADDTVRIFDDSGNLLSFDTKHLTPAGARVLGELWFEHPLLRRFR